MDSQKVLIIDDEEELCFLLGNMLTGMGYKTVYAFSVTEGYAKYMEERPAIVFVDLNMPDGSGFSLMGRIMQVDPDIPVVMISAQDSKQERNTAWENGASYFIGKPLNRTLIEEAMVAIEHRK